MLSSLNLPYSTTCENDYVLFSAYFNLLWGKVGLGAHCAIWMCVCVCVCVRARVRAVSIWTSSGLLTCMKFRLYCMLH